MVASAPGFAAPDFPGETEPLLNQLAQASPEDPNCQF